MGKVFSGCEVVELAIQIEKNGVEFYKELALKTGDRKLKDTFEYLAGEEGKHIEVFKELFNSVCEYKPKEAYPDEYFSYMNSLASQYVFTRKDKGAEIAKTVKSDMEGIEIGIKAEEDSINFYEEIKKIVSESDQSMVGEVIKQEKDHWKKLTDLKKEMRP
ncbi:MAG: ferritin family protein [Candidatus Omnitrophota bacterium]